MTATTLVEAAPSPLQRTGHRLVAAWPLAALVALAAALRFATLGSQSLWYDEAFTPVHTLHASLSATLRAIAHTENTPPLWYLLEWAVSRLLGNGALALRLLSAIAGVALVPVGWALARQFASRRAANTAAALIALNPLLVWYSQEARAYALYMLMAALALLCFARAYRVPSPRRMAQFALAGSLALATHYFAVFLLAPMCLLLLLRRERRYAAAATAVIVLVGGALLPLILSQAGHGTQWIGRWALSDRLAAIPQYYLTGYYGSSLGHSVELLVALPILAGLIHGLWRVLDPAEERGVLLLGVITAAAVLTPLALALLGVDYLAPRNLVAAMVPLTVLVGIVIASARSGRVGVALALLAAGAFAAITLDGAFNRRLQRGDWRALARLLAPSRPGRAITTVELGSAPLEYYLPPLRNLQRGTAVTVTEIDAVGYAPLRAAAAQPPASGFRLLQRDDIHGLVVYRFIAPQARTVAQRTLVEHAITAGTRAEVLIRPGGSLTGSRRH